MKIELIPVIEITNYDQDAEMPSSGPYWKFADDWETYRISTNIKAGFSENLKPYLKGSSLYRISEINDEDLLKIIHKEIAIQQTDENLGVDDLTSSFSGGYILKIDGVDNYFPQCCGNLGDIEDWMNLFEDEEPFEKIENKIIFDFLNSELQEPYVPPILEDYIEVDNEILKISIENAKKELNKFAENLIRINKNENLNIPEIEKILIYGNEN